MKKSKFTDAQIAFVLRQAEQGLPIKVICRRLGVSRKVLRSGTTEFQ